MPMAQPTTDFELNHNRGNAVSHFSSCSQAPPQLFCVHISLHTIYVLVLYVIKMICTFPCHGIPVVTHHKVSTHQTHGYTRQKPMPLAVGKGFCGYGCGYNYCRPTRNPYPPVRVGVPTGKGTGILYPKIPVGYPCTSLATPGHSFFE
jgi:hypothetical protein